MPDLFYKNGSLKPSCPHRSRPLGSLKAHPYFRLPPPKSTGRELFSLAWLQSHLRGNESPFDVQRTLVQFTAETIADAIFQAASNT